MIELYSGVPGSGKSLHMAADILDYCKYGNIVITNFPINLEIKHIKKAYEKGLLIILDNMEITPMRLIQLSKELNSMYKLKEDSIHLFIDECQLLFNSREWNLNANRMDWISFFSQHRHYKYHIVMVAQFDRMIDRQIRCLIEYEVRHKKAKNFGWRGWVFCLFAGFNSILLVRKWYGDNYFISTKILHVRKKFYSLYDTNYIFNSLAPEGSGGSLATAN